MTAALGWLAAAAGLGVAQDARWDIAPGSVTVGQPVTAALVVEHDADTRPELGEVALDLDDSWVVLGDGGPAAPLPGRTRSTRVWSVMSLEAGTRAWPAATVVFADGRAVIAPGSSLDVAAELAPDEDAPRPLPGFHPIPERAGPLRPPHLLIGLVGGLLVAAGWWWTTRRAGAARAAEDEDELARLAGLAPADWDAPGAAREYAWGLATILRSAARRGLAEDREGLTDEELVAALRREGRGAAPVDELEALLAECARIKYAGERPTRFALEDLGRRAEAWLGAARASGEEAAA